MEKWIKIEKIMGKMMVELWKMMIFSPFSSTGSVQMGKMVV
jgi:hypothetical protein